MRSAVVASAAQPMVPVNEDARHVPPGYGNAVTMRP